MEKEKRGQYAGVDGGAGDGGASPYRELEKYDLIRSYQEDPMSIFSGVPMRLVERETLDENYRDA